MTRPKGPDMASPWCKCKSYRTGSLSVGSFTVMKSKHFLSAASWVPAILVWVFASMMTTVASWLVIVSLMHSCRSKLPAALPWVYIILSNFTSWLPSRNVTVMDGSMAGRA